MIPKMWNRVETIISEERNPHVIAPIVGTICEDQDEGIIELCKDEHIRIHEAI